MQGEKNPTKTDFTFQIPLGDPPVTSLPKTFPRNQKFQAGANYEEDRC